MRARPPQRDHYHHCNGRQFARGLYATWGRNALSKSLNGDYVERLLWANIEAFLRNPGEILDKLRQRLSIQDSDRRPREKELMGLQPRLAEKGAERDRMLPSWFLFPHLSRTPPQHPHRPRNSESSFIVPAGPSLSTALPTESTGVSPKGDRDLLSIQPAE
jgi:hypothetical protein